MARFAFSVGLAAALMAACSGNSSKAKPVFTSAEPTASTALYHDAGADTPAHTLVVPPHARDSALTAAGLVEQDDDLVDLSTIMPDLLLDMRYASNRNFVGEIIYPVPRCLLRRSVAKALVRVQERLAAAGYQLLLWDCYRPFSVQERFWQLMPDQRYVAKPVRKHGQPFVGSKHNRGAAVDLTLADTQGTLLSMPTDHDDFSERAHRGSAEVTPLARANSILLDQAMSAEGFEGIATEWWHFDYQGWRHYPLSDQSLVD